MLFPWSLSGGLVMYPRGRKKEGLDSFNRLALDKSGYESTELSRGVPRKSSDICGCVLNEYLQMTRMEVYIGNPRGQDPMVRIVVGLSLRVDDGRFPRPSVLL